jgi:hypothetical protein
MGWCRKIASCSYNSKNKPCMEAYACNPSTKEVEAEGSQVWCQSRLYKETLSQKMWDNYSNP